MSKKQHLEAADKSSGVTFKFPLYLSRDGKGITMYGLNILMGYNFVNVSPTPESSINLPTKKYDLDEPPQFTEAQAKLYADSYCMSLNEMNESGWDLISSAKSPREPTNNIDNEIKRLCNEGKRLQAIKLYYEETNCRLIEAKRYVDDLCP